MRQFKALRAAFFIIVAFCFYVNAQAQSAAVLEPFGKMCLDFLKDRLKDPESAYVRDISKDGTVYAMTLYAKNSYGGIVPRQIACEIKNNRIDAGWTEIHLKRLGWQ